MSQVEYVLTFDDVFYTYYHPRGSYYESYLGKYIDYEIRKYEGFSHFDGTYIANRNPTPGCEWPENATPSFETTITVTYYTGSGCGSPYDTVEGTQTVKSPRRLLYPWIDHSLSRARIHSVLLEYVDAPGIGVSLVPDPFYPCNKSNISSSTGTSDCGFSPAVFSGTAQSYA